MQSTKSVLPLYQRRVGGDIASKLNVYWKIKDFVEKNKDSKITIARGDCKQLKSVQPITNTKDYEPYVDSTTDNIFEHHILLKACKRLHTDEDREKLHNIKQDIFVNKISVDGLVKKYGFRYTDDITSSPSNTAFLNNTCKNVSSRIKEMETRTSEYECGGLMARNPASYVSCLTLVTRRMCESEYECGERLICREYTVIDNHSFNVSFQYDLVEIVDGALLLKKCQGWEASSITIR